MELVSLSDFGSSYTKECLFAFFTRPVNLDILAHSAGAGMEERFFFWAFIHCFGQMGRSLHIMFLTNCFGQFYFG
jgi:hypothetical protein